MLRDRDTPKNQTQRPQWRNGRLADPSRLVAVPLRFPNPGSDIPRMLHNYRLILSAVERDQIGVFDLDYVTDVLTENFQASSRGAVGVAARERSANADRSRDPLYNQAKMYSEVYRMLGWLRPTERRLQFRTTVLGAQIAEDFRDRPDLVYGLLRQCLLGVCFPNPSTENIGVVSQRPFAWLLRLMAALGGTITRHEMIIGLLAVDNDLNSNAFTKAVAAIKSLRGGGRDVLNDAVFSFANSANLEVNTLENYTRLPVGVLSSNDIGWAISCRVDGLYDEPVRALSLSALGESDASWVENAVDLRETQLDHFPLDERAHLANYAHYALLVRSGLEVSRVQEALDRASYGCRSILNSLGITSPHQLLYSPVQQTNDLVLARAESIE